MTIAAHFDIDTDSDHNFLFNCLSLLASTHPEDHFIFFTDKALSADKILSRNITPVVVKPFIKNSLLLYYWYNFKLPKLLQRYNAESFISEKPTLSFRTKAAQFLVIKNASFLQKNITAKHKRFLQKYFVRFVYKAQHLFTTEQYIAQAINKQYPAAATKNTVIFHGLNSAYKPIGWDEKEKNTAKYTDGKDYFLLYVSHNTAKNIVAALKAFSIFKKWQKSSMMLVLLLDNVASENLITGFDLYKYKDEVKLIAKENDAQAAQIIASAYAFIYLPKNTLPEYIGLYSLASKVPLVTLQGDAASSLYEQATLYSSLNEKEIAANIQLLYKDESVRNKLISNGSALIKKYDWKKSSDLLWDMLSKKTVL